MRTKLVNSYRAILREPLAKTGGNLYQSISIFHALYNVSKPIVHPKLLSYCLLFCQKLTECARQENYV